MNSSTASVSIIIPNYNGYDLLRQNIPLVIKASHNSRNKIKEIIVVDDASTDKSVKLLKENFPEVKVIQHKTNRRFSAAVNTGVRMAKGELVCLLNSDVTPSNDFLKSSFKHFRNKQLFGVSFSEAGYSWARGEFIDGFVEHSPGKNDGTSHYTFWLSGGSSIIRRNLWMKLKGLDEKLYTPFYWEDLDLSYRAMKRGWKLIWEPLCIVHHEHESTNKVFKSSYRVRIQERNQLFFIWKNITSKRMFQKHIRGLFKRVFHHPGYFRIILMALVKFPSIRKFRSIEKKQATVSDESIFSMFS